MNQIFPVLHRRNILGTFGFNADVKEFGAGLEQLAGEFEFHGKKLRKKEKVPDLHEQFLTGGEWTFRTLEAPLVLDGNRISCERHVPPPLAPSSGMHHKAGTSGHAKPLQCRELRRIKPSCLKQ